jgi:hypothetical protein
MGDVTAVTGGPGFVLAERSGAPSFWGNYISHFGICTRNKIESAA